jgi:hypothetical protein
MLSAETYGFTDRLVERSLCVRCSMSFYFYRYLRALGSEEHQSIDMRYDRATWICVGGFYCWFEMSFPMTTSIQVGKCVTLGASKVICCILSLEIYWGISTANSSFIDMFIDSLTWQTSWYYCFMINTCFILNNNSFYLTFQPKMETSHRHSIDDDDFHSQSIYWYALFGRRRV